MHFGGKKRGDAFVRIVTYYTEATGVIWFAVESRKYITPWCMSPFNAVKCWFKKERYEKESY